MEACWDKDTAKRYPVSILGVHVKAANTEHQPLRPSFRQILPLLDIVIIDSVVKDETSREFWQKEFLGRVSALYDYYVGTQCSNRSLQDEIKWEEFVDKLMKRLGQSANPADLKVKCQKAVIGTSNNPNANRIVSGHSN